MPRKRDAKYPTVDVSPDEIRALQEILEARYVNVELRTDTPKSTRFKNQVLVRVKCSGPKHVLLENTIDVSALWGRDGYSSLVWAQYNVLWAAIDRSSVEGVDEDLAKLTVSA